MHLIRQLSIYVDAQQLTRQISMWLSGVVAALLPDPIQARDYQSDEAAHLNRLSFLENSSTNVMKDRECLLL